MDPVSLVAETVAAKLEDRSWNVISERRALRQGIQSDIVAESPGGSRYIIEVNLGEGHAHFSEIARLERLAAEERSLAGHQRVRPILLTNREVPISIRNLATDLAVKIVNAAGSENEVAEALLAYLDTDIP
jgi:hypothetical protein